MNTIRNLNLPRLAFAAACAGALGTLSATTTQAQPQAWPQRSVRVILPFGAGSATDIAARLIGERLSTKWGKPVVVENRPGGDGLVAINAFVSANDDHVLLYASSASFIAHPYTQEKMPYDLNRDLLPIARVAETILSVGVPASSGIKTIADFVAAAKQAPDKFNAAGAAGLPEFAVMAFIKAENLGITKVPYKDIAQGARDLAENRIQFLLSSLGVVQPLITADKVRVIAVGGRQRTPLVPGAPTVTEAGYPGLAMETTSGFYGPKIMPLELRQRVGREVVEIATEPAISQRIVASGQDMRAEGPEGLARAQVQQAERAAEIAKILGMIAKN